MSRNNKRKYAEVAGVGEAQGLLGEIPNNPSRQLRPPKATAWLWGVAALP